MPFLLMAPFLFVAGVVFAYIVAMPSATEFLLNFNDDQFNIEVRAREYYSFLAMCLISVGVLFQIPTGILGVRSSASSPRADRREPALRDPGHRGAGDASARHRPDHDAALDGAAGTAVRGEPDPGADLPAQGRGGRDARRAAALSPRGGVLGRPRGLRRRCFGKIANVPIAVARRRPSSWRTSLRITALRSLRRSRVDSQTMSPSRAVWT